MSYEPPMRARAWLVLFAGVVVVVGIGVSIIWLVTRSDDETAGGDNGATTTEESTTTTAPTSTVPTTTSLETPDDFRRIFVELMTRRAEIYTINPDPNLVDEYATPFAAALYDIDKDNLGELQSTNQRFANADVTLLGVRFESYTDTEATAGLTAVVERVAFNVLDANGTVVEHVPARGREFLGVDVRRVEGAWRIDGFTSLPVDEQAFELVIAEGVPQL